jgi:hypothetical protein
MMMDFGAGAVPFLDALERLATGETAAGGKAPLGWAGAELALDVLPFAGELGSGASAARQIARPASVYPLAIYSQELADFQLSALRIRRATVLDRKQEP